MDPAPEPTPCHERRHRQALVCATEQDHMTDTSTHTEAEHTRNRESGTPLPASTPPAAVPAANKTDADPTEGRGEQEQLKPDGR
jgi:hypothetical protein